MSPENDETTGADCLTPAEGDGEESLGGTDPSPDTDEELVDTRYQRFGPRASMPPRSRTTSGTFVRGGGQASTDNRDRVGGSGP